MQAWEIEARVAVQKLLTDYGRNVDSGRLERLAALFTEQCHYDMGGELLVDRPAILRQGERVRAMFRDAPNIGGRVRHHMTPGSIEFVSATEAKVTSYFITMGHSGPDHWGIYRDVVVRVDGQWLFARRVVTVEGHSADSPAAPSQ